MSTESLKTQIAREFGTPAVVIDLDRVEANIARVQKRAKPRRRQPAAHQDAQEPRRSPACRCGRRQRHHLPEAGRGRGDGRRRASTISSSATTCSARRRSAAWPRCCNALSTVVAADNPTIAGLPQAAEIAGRPLGVVIECDTGRKRAGVETATEAIELAGSSRSSPACASMDSCSIRPRRRGRDAALLRRGRGAARALGLEARIVSTGGTPNLPNMGQLEGATEHRAGTYIFNDRMMLACGRGTPEDCALNVYATVVSRAAPERGILDAGSKTLTADTGALDDGFGLILEYPQARIAGFAEEHGFLDLSRSNARPQVGEVVRVVPNHVCVVVNMVDRMIAVRGDKIVDVLPVAARGRLA